MAFEYLMAFYMFRKDLDTFVKNISRLDDFDYPRIPRHYEEAILIYSDSTNNQPNLKGRRISEVSLMQFKGFLQMALLYENNPRLAFEEMSKKYGDTYFFYYLFGVSGLKNE